DVDVAVEHRGFDADLGQVRAHVGQRDLGGLLHDVAQLAGEGERALALGGVGLDVEDVAARPGDRETGRHAGNRGALHRVGQEARPAKVVLQFADVDGQ